MKLMIRSLMSAISHENVENVEKIMSEPDMTWLTSDMLASQRMVYAFAKSDRMKRVVGPHMRKFYKSLEYVNHFEPSDECSICFAPVDARNNGVMLIPSMKVYHRGYTEWWLRKSPTDPETRQIITAAFQIEYSLVDEAVSAEMNPVETESPDEK